MSPSSSSIHEQNGGFFASTRYVTFVVAFALFTDMFFYDLIVPCLPSILEDRVAVPHETVQYWISACLAAYGIASILGPPLAAWWVDHCKRKRIPFFSGLILITASTLLFFLGTHIAVLLIARVLQGFAGVLVYVSGMALLTVYTRKDGVGTAIGASMTGYSVGELFGPVLGGLTYDLGGHWATCALALSVILADFVFRFLLHDRERDGDRQSIQVDDEDGISEENLGEDSSEHRNEHEVVPGPHDKLLAGDRIQRNYNTSSRSTTVAESQALEEFSGVSSAEAQYEPSEPEHVLGLILKDKRCLASLLVVVVCSSMRGAFEGLLPKYTAERFGFSPSPAGAVMFAFLAPTLLAPWIGGLTERQGPWLLSIPSSGIVAASFVGLALVQGDGNLAIMAFCGLILVLGVALGGLLISNIVAMTLLALDIGGEGGRVEGKVYALNTMVFASGLLLGPLAAAGVPVQYSWSFLCLTFAGLAVVTGITLALTWPRRQKLGGPDETSASNSSDA